MSRFRQPIVVENKEELGFDPVTLADKGAEAAIRAWLAEHLPDHGILGEEQAPTNADAEYCWIIDPVDGTRAFISGLPTWGTLIGLNKNGVPVAGVLHQPFTGEKYLATGEGTELHWKETRADLATSSVTDLSTATAMTTAPEAFAEGDVEDWWRIEKAVRLVRYGFDCYAYAMLASGHIDLVVESGLNAYDIAPLIPIVEQAGGIVRSWDGGSAAGGGQVIAAANEELFEKAIKILRA